MATIKLPEKQGQANLIEMDQRINPVNLPLMSRPKIRELANMSSSGEKIDPNVEGILVKIAEDFISKVTQSSADLARHRKSKILDVEDVQLHLGNSPNLFFHVLIFISRTCLGSGYSWIWAH